MNHVVRYLFGALLVVLIAGCSTVDVKAAWKNPSYSQHPKKIMVIGLSSNAVLRRIFEDEFVRQIKARGPDAIAGYTVLPKMEKNDQEAIAAQVKAHAADTVLITRLVSRKTVQVYVPGTVFVAPPHYGLWPSYYNYGYQTTYTPGYMAEEEYAVVETNLYDASNDALIWAAWSEAGITGSDEDLIRVYISKMVQKMAEQNLLAP